MKTVLKNKPNQHDENKKIAISKIFAFSIDRLKYVEEGKEELTQSWSSASVFFIEPEYMEIDLYVV